MIVLPSYGSLVGANARGTAFVEVVKSQFHDLLRALVNSIEVDEFWYLQTYRDVADAVLEGRVQSAADHYAPPAISRTACPVASRSTSPGTFTPIPT